MSRIGATVSRRLWTSHGAYPVICGSGRSRTSRPSSRQSRPVRRASAMSCDARARHRPCHGDERARSGHAGPQRLHHGDARGGDHRHAGTGRGGDVGRGTATATPRPASSPSTWCRSPLVSGGCRGWTWASARRERASWRRSTRAIGGRTRRGSGGRRGHRVKVRHVVAALITRFDALLAVRAA